MATGEAGTCALLCALLLASLTSARGTAGAQVGGIMQGWYSEVGSLWPGQAMSLKVRLHSPPALHPARCAFRRLRVPHRDAHVLTGEAAAARGQIRVPRRAGAQLHNAASRAQLHSKTRAEQTACCCAGLPSQVFESETYGRVLVLDGCIQLTERDEFSYQARRGAAHTSRRLA
jgi:hypothetical protein